MKSMHQVRSNFLRVSYGGLNGDNRMSDQEILTKAIQKAIDGGYHTWEFSDKYTEDDELRYLIGTIYDDPSENGNVQSVEALIFNHEFAKSIWGEEEKQAMNQFFDKIVKHGWQYYLQEMVISPDPIKYLGEHLDD